MIYFGFIASNVLSRFDNINCRYLLLDLDYVNRDNSQTEHNKVVVVEGEAYIVV